MRKADVGEQFAWRRERAVQGTLRVRQGPKKRGEEEGEDALLFAGVVPARFHERYKEAVSIEENTLNLLDDVWDVVAEDDGFAAAAALRMKQAKAAVAARQQFEEANPELDEAGKLARLTELRAFLRECQDPNPPSTGQKHWRSACSDNDVVIRYPEGAKKKWVDSNGVRVPKEITYQTLAASSTECCLMDLFDKDAPADAEDTSAPVVHYSEKEKADKRKKNSAKVEHIAVSTTLEEYLLKKIRGFCPVVSALEKWVRVKAERAAAHYSGIGKRGGDASALVEGYKKAEAKRIRVMRRSRLGQDRKGPTGAERAPRNLYDLYVWQLFLAGNLTPACPWESLTGLKKDPENPPSFTGE